MISDKSLQDRHPNSTSQPKEVRLYNKAKEELISIDTARSSYTRSSYPSLRNARRINPRQLCKRTEQHLMFPRITLLFLESTALSAWTGQATHQI